MAAEIHRALLSFGRSGASLLKQGSGRLPPILLWDRGKCSTRPDQCVQSANLAAAVAIGAIEPVIEAILEAIGAMLLIAFNEAREKRFTNVRFAVAIGVLGVKNFGRSADDDSFSPRNDSIRKIQAIEEHR